MFLAYAAGMGLAVGTAALAVAPSRDAVPRGLRRWGPRIARVRGGLLAAAGRTWPTAGGTRSGCCALAVVVGVLVAAPLLIAVARAGRRTRESGPEEQRLVREKEAIRERAG